MTHKQVLKDDHQNYRQQLDYKDYVNGQFHENVSDMVRLQLQQFVVYPSNIDVQSYTRYRLRGDIPSEPDLIVRAKKTTVP